MPKARPSRKATASKRAKTKSAKKTASSQKSQTKAAKKASPGKKAQAKVSKRARPNISSLSEAQLKKMRVQAEANPKLLAVSGYMNAYLEASEYQVIEMMEYANVWSGAKPPNPGGSGSAEFGLFDYWLNNPGDNVVLQDLQAVWKFLFSSLPVTQINATNYQNFLKAVAPGRPGLVAADGTWFSESVYSLDPLWITAFVDYLWTLYWKEYFQPFPQNPPTVPIKGANSSYVTIALVGDWGTGNYTNGPAGSVMSNITALNPDYIVHLGDVYYGGTANQEQTNLLNMWPASYAGKSFTLNSNHEMYDGGNGYFKTALASNLFRSQNRTSYFVLQYGRWAVVGLDSAYWSTSPMVMSGSIQEASNDSGAMAQPQFLRYLLRTGVTPQNSIVLTHHNPIEYDGSSVVTDNLGNNLLAQVVTAFLGTPKAWYWGHVHNGIVHPNPTFTKNNMYGRCVGHGALPYGNGWGLENAPASQVKAYANTPNPKLLPRVMNGFVMLKITTGGQVTETFYQQDGTVTPWVSPFTYQLG